LTTLGEYRWLWIGLFAAVAVPALGLGTRLAAVLDGWVPLPWSRVGVGLLIFAAMAALHFRSHWVACLQTLGAEKQRTQAAAQLLSEVRMDGSNGVRVIKDNLDLVAGGSQRPQEAELYLQGAQAHAAKLEQVFERLEGIRIRLGTTTDD
jgi:hypothetical protein